MADDEVERLWRRVQAERDEAAVVRLAALIIRRGGGRLLHIFKTRDRSYCGRWHNPGEYKYLGGQFEAVWPDGVEAAVASGSFTLCRVCDGSLAKARRKEAAEKKMKELRETRLRKQAERNTQPEKARGSSHV